MNKLSSIVKHIKLKRIEVELHKIYLEKVRLIRKQNFDEAAKCRDKEVEILKMLSEKDRLKLNYKPKENEN